jgi:hypothetical protein
LRVGICLLLCRGLLLRGLFALFLLAHMVTNRATGGCTGQAVVAGYVSCDTADQGAFQATRAMARRMIKKWTS